MTLIAQMKRDWKPSEESSRVHIKATINNYRELDPYVFHKQLDITAKNLHFVGFTKQRAKELILDVFYEEGMNAGEWINGRTTDEIIINS